MSDSDCFSCFLILLILLVLYVALIVLHLFILKDIKHEELSVRKRDSIKVMETGTVEGRMDRKKEQKGTRTVMVQYIKDQLIRAKVYLSLTATTNNAHFIRELRQRIKELQKALGDATTDSELPGR